MSELEIINTTNLLNHVNTIKNKYDDLAEYTGENYNVFDVLNIYSDELSHSAIIGNLLDAKGKHGQKDVFLKLFLEEIQGFEDECEQFKTLNSFKPEKSKVYIEKHIGGVNHIDGEGGRIDILINDGQNNIIIENKVWAGDQNIQLIRYNNHDLNAPILYLTLDGKPPSEASIKHEVKTKKLTLGKEFICISYQETIKNWLEKCIKEMANKPIIRESLNQYLVLVKQLTNQSTNNKMNEEIINLILENKKYLSSAKIIENGLNTIKNNLILKLNRILDIADKDKDNIDNIIKTRHNNGFLNILKQFPHKGNIFVRLDIILDGNLDYSKNETIIIELFTNYNNLTIESNIYTNSLTYKEKINSEIYTNEYEYTRDNLDIFKEIKNKIKEILEN